MRISNRACHIVFIVAAMMFWPGGNAYAGFFGPNNFEECVEKYAKDVMVERVTPLMLRACRAKFPKAGEQNPPLNIDYYDCILKHLPEIDTILATTGVQSSCKQAHGPKWKHDGESANIARQNQGKVLQVQRAGQYHYLEIDQNGQKLWIAGVAEVAVGDTVRWSKPTPMKGYYSKTLDRTFDEVLFVSTVEVVQ